MGYRILEGDVTEMLKTLPDESVDAIVTDPPYGLEFMGKEWDVFADKPRRVEGTGGREAPFAHHAVKLTGQRGMSFQEWCKLWATEALRVLKPGGHLLAFGGSRTYHRLATAVEDAGFEIRDQIMWLYGSGFPKSLDVSKAIQKQWTGNREQGTAKALPTDHCALTTAHWRGWGTALKPAHEPIVVARKALIGTVAENVLAYGTGGINIDGCRIGETKRTPGGMPSRNDGSQIFGKYAAKDGSESGYNANIGRWPANVIHDGSDDVLAAFPEAPGALAPVRGTEPSSVQKNVFGERVRVAGPPLREPRAGRARPSGAATNFAMKSGEPVLDTGSAARFFYCAKADKEEREIGCYAAAAAPLAYGNQAQAEVKRGNMDHAGLSGMNTVKMRGNTHPTVKPVDLMAYLCRLVTPAGGTVLDCFLGSGSTGIAALREGFEFIGIEVNPGYAAIARMRMDGDAPLFNSEQATVDSDQ